MKPGPDRRRRLDPPLILKFIGICYITSPIFNILLNSTLYNDELRNAFYRYDNAAVFLLLITPIVGLGILQVRPWGWYAFVAHSTAMLAYNIYNLLMAGNTYNYLIFYNSILLLGFCAYFLQREVSAPYFSNLYRGFRASRRQQIKKPVLINGNQLSTIDVSSRGALVHWKNCDLNPGDEINLQFQGQEAMLGGIVRIAEDNVGIAFRAGKPASEDFEFHSIE